MWKIKIMWKLECLLKWLSDYFNKWYRKIKTTNTRKGIERSRTSFCFLPDYIEKHLDEERPYWKKWKE